MAMTFIDTAPEFIEYLKEMKVEAPHKYRHVVKQYEDMSNGGDGGRLGSRPPGYTGKTTCREFNFPNKRDRFFRDILAGLDEV